MTGIAIQSALALAFSGGCAIIYLLFARGRKNVGRDALLIFITLLAFSLVRMFVSIP